MTCTVGKPLSSWFSPPSCWIWTLTAARHRKGLATGLPPGELPLGVRVQGKSIGFESQNPQRGSI